KKNREEMTEEKYLKKEKRNKNGKACVVPKKAKKRRNKPGEQMTGKRSNRDDIDEKLVPKKHKKTKTTLAENQETAEETGFNLRWSGFQALGQWSTAQFDSSEKQQKFLRLMGGFKKGFQPSAGTAERANMALGKDGQQQLQQKLLEEFDRAHSRRLDSSNRGAGIGFTAPANKKFFIDINASRSVRFDD
uniref:Small acidic protein-like domain-containing protein n=1 Tax=Tetraodon nigroviridis TaxID=99883 RepID=H3C3A0_TETNG